MSKGFVACCLFILNFCLLTFEPCSNKAFPFLHRIKDIYSFEREGQHVIVTASSDGYIKMWDLDLNKVGLLNCLLPAWKNIRQPKLQTVLLQRLLLNKWGSLTRNLGVLCSVQERRVCLRTCFHVLVWVCIFNAFLNDLYNLMILWGSHLLFVESRASVRTYLASLLTV